MRILDSRKGKISVCCRAIPVFLILFFSSSLLLAKTPGSIDTLRQMGKTFSEIANRASASVVGIEAEKTVSLRYSRRNRIPFENPFSPFDDDFFERFFGPSRPYNSPESKSRQVAKGSGFIISPDGYILTNNHLVGKADKVTVKLLDGRALTAEIIGTDPESEVAVIKIDAEVLPILELADSDELEVGQWVLAIGNPFGLSHSVTAGIVSAKGRNEVGITAYEDFIQTDAAINPGNSGGPLVDLDGKVVGINTAIVTGGTGYVGNIGIGFAIPINMARTIYEQLVSEGEVTRGFLGVGYEQLTPELAKAFELAEDVTGVVITEIVADSAAEKAGLKHNDIIVEFNGKPVDSAAGFRNNVAMLKPGTEVNIAVIRDGKRIELEITLGKRPSGAEHAGARIQTLKDLGLSVENLTGDLAKRFGYEGLSGVIVSKVESGSLSAVAGLKPGVLIMEVNREPVENTKEFNEKIQQAVEEGNVVLLVTDGRRRQFIILQLPEK